MIFVFKNRIENIGKLPGIFPALNQLKQFIETQGTIVL